MLNKTFNVELNTKHSGHKLTDILVNQGDTRSIVFNIRVFDGAEELNYNDIDMAALFFIKPDRLVYQANADWTPQGFTCTLTQQPVAVPGVVTAGLALYGENKERITTLYFTFMVKPDPMREDVVESSVEFDALGRAIALLEWAILQYEQFPRLNVLGKFNTEDELKAAFPDGSDVGGGFFVGDGDNARYFYWSIITGTWENANPWRGPGGATGPPGLAATIHVGQVNTVPADRPASVRNSGTTHNAIFDIEIPQGLTGQQGPVGPRGESGLVVPLQNGFFRLELRDDGHLYIVSHGGGSHGLSINTDGHLILTL